MQMFDAQAHNDAQQGRGFERQWCEFTWEAVKDTKEESGFRNVAFIRIRVDRLNEVFRPVEDQDKSNYQSRYKAFVEGNEEPPEGTPVKEWSAISPANLASCKASRIYTVEQLAESPDEALQKGGLVGLKYKAIDWLAHNSGAGVLGNLRDEVEKLKDIVKESEERNIKLIRAQKGNEST